MACNDMMDAECVLENEEHWEELRRLAAENVAQHVMKMRFVPDIEYVPELGFHAVGIPADVDREIELNMLEERAMAGMASLVYFFHIRMEDVRPFLEGVAED